MVQNIKYFNLSISTDVFGAQAGVDAKPKIGFGDAVRDEDGSSDRRKRQAGANDMNDESQDKDAQELHGIFTEMWQTMIEGGKKVMKKVAEMIDKDPGENQEEKTY